MSLNPHIGERPEPARKQIEAEVILSPNEFRKIASILYEESGIYLQESKSALVQSRLAKRLRMLGLRSFRDYCALLAGADGVNERTKMIGALTTNVTKFFREPHHFEHLAKKVMPPLIESARRGGRVRVWSAGCSSGQEPSSLALTILSTMPDAAIHDVRVLASDIDADMVDAGRRGVYSETALAGVPGDILERWFTPVGPRKGKRAESWSVGEELRQIVAFRELNLNGEWPMRGKFHAIFCRNVVIYFEEKTQATLWSRFEQQLTRDGVLYVGHSERVTGPAAADFRFDGNTTYRLNDGGPS